MRRIIRMMFIATAIVSLSSVPLSAGEAKGSKLFPDPPLGLGADIPDDLLFAGDENDARPAASPENPASISGWETEVRIEPSKKETLPWLGNANTSCLDRATIMTRLADDGWHDFHRLSIRPRTIAFNTRRGGGSLRRLQVDRCSGRIIHESAAYLD